MEQCFLAIPDSAKAVKWIWNMENHMESFLWAMPQCICIFNFPFNSIFPCIRDIPARLRNRILSSWHTYIITPKYIAIKKPCIWVLIYKFMNVNCLCGKTGIRTLGTWKVQRFSRPSRSTTPASFLDRFW